MSTPVGGLRKRLIKYNFELMITDALDQLHWFDEDRGHKPITVTGTPIDYDRQEVIIPNIVSIAPEDINTMEWEMGSLMEEVRWDFFVDVYAENDSVGLHLASDIMDILKGKMPSVGRVRPTLLVNDYQADPPSELFYCYIENVDMAKVRNWQDQWQRYWYVVGCEIVDYYTDENDEGSYI